MKRILMLLLISCICPAQEFGDFSELMTEDYRGRSLEDRCGDFTELVGKDYHTRKFSVLKKIEKGKALVTIIQDSAGPMYCVKQINLGTYLKHRSANYLEGHVRDVVASYVAESMNIRVNKVRIIPASVDFPGKQYPNRIATLHSFAPGSNRSHDFPFPLKLEQYLKARVSVRDRGLTLRVISDMSLHDDLPPMVAVDTFISNPDRSGNNLFWDARTERFCGIDLELAFKLPLARNLSEVACYQIEKFFKSPRFFLSKQQYRALEQYNVILQGLIEKNHPNDTCQLMQNVAEYAHVIFANKGDYIYSDHSLKQYCEKINVQYNSSKKLVKMIDTLLQSLYASKHRIRFH